MPPHYPSTYSSLQRLLDAAAGDERSPVLLHQRAFDSGCARAFFVAELHQNGHELILLDSHVLQPAPNSENHAVVDGVLGWSGGSVKQKGSQAATFLFSVLFLDF